MMRKLGVQIGNSGAEYKPSRGQVREGNLYAQLLQGFTRYRQGASFWRVSSYTNWLDCRGARIHRDASTIGMVFARCCERVGVWRLVLVHKFWLLSRVQRWFEHCRLQTRCHLAFR